MLWRLPLPRHVWRGTRLIPEASVVVISIIYVQCKPMTLEEADVVNIVVRLVVWWMLSHLEGDYRCIYLSRAPKGISRPLHDAYKPADGLASPSYTFTEYSLVHHFDILWYGNLT